MLDAVTLVWKLCRLRPHMAAALMVVLATLVQSVFAEVEPDPVEEDSEVESTDPSDSGSADRHLVYVPPPRGKPVGLRGAGTRYGVAPVSRSGRTLFRLAPLEPLPPGSSLVFPLVPREKAFTLVANPTVYWYVGDLASLWPDLASGDVVGTVRVHLLLKPQDGSPGLQPSSEPWRSERLVLGQERVHAVRLEGFDLQPGRAYLWILAFYSENRAVRLRDEIYGFIEVAEAPSTLDSAIDPDARLRALAVSGIWYDLMHELSRRIELAPGDQLLWDSRNDLLEQVDRPPIAPSQ